MLKIPDLKLGFRDAENYQRRENKELFNTIFVKNAFLAELLRPSTFFLIGDKGTGKTAYAVFLANNHYFENETGIGTVSQLKYVREADYKKFVMLKHQLHLQLADYSSIWKVILLLLLAKNINPDEAGLKGFFQRGLKIKDILNALDDFFSGSFPPEIQSALEFAERSNVAAETIAKYAKVSADTSNIRESFSESRFQTSLQFIRRQLENALSELKLKNNQILFIDGIDIRPGSVEYQDYLECIKGLANAIWELNNDFFPKIRDSKGRLRVILLIRPDIFTSIGLQNTTNKVTDNSVYLDWRTTYPQYRTSRLFFLTNQLLSAGQDVSLPLGIAWDHYFPWQSVSTNLSRDFDPSFVSLLRISYSRPRDIVAAIQILQQEFIEKQNDPDRIFLEADITSADFMTKYSEYLMGSIKDQLAFYYNDEEYELFLRFFTFLNGSSEFSYDEYLVIYQSFTDFILRSQKNLPGFIESADKFIQFLYDSNIICYIDETDMQPLFRWCYRERSPSNISPKVSLGKRYRIHYGLYKALNVGNRNLRPLGQSHMERF